ncbi:MAG: ATP-binding cassette domain-containing protein, partial [Coprobacillus sp.]
MIELRHITKTFHTAKGDIEACQDVNLTIQDGEIFGVIGYSGAGKSTLVRIINQLEKQTSGEVIIDSVDISLLPAKELRHKRTKIGMIFQHFNLLWSRTVFRNIELSLEIAGVD